MVVFWVYEDKMFECVRCFRVIKDFCSECEVVVYFGFLMIGNYDLYVVFFGYVLSDCVWCVVCFEVLYMMEVCFWVCGWYFWGLRIKEIFDSFGYCVSDKVKYR